jgi:hypothetical protein
MYQFPLRNQSSTRTLATVAAIATQRRREHIWAWVSVLLLMLCWDASLRLDEKVPLPRVRLAHAVGSEFELQARAEPR